MSRPTKVQALARLLSDRREHSQQEVLAVAGYRYTGRVEDLRKLGYVIESIHVQGSEWRYRLIAEPGETRQLALA